MLLNNFIATDTFDPSNMPKTFNLTFEPVHPFQSWTVSIVGNNCRGSKMIFILGQKIVG